MVAQSFEIQVNDTSRNRLIDNIVTNTGTDRTEFTDAERESAAEILKNNIHYLSDRHTSRKKMILRKTEGKEKPREKAYAEAVATGDPGEIDENYTLRNYSGIFYFGAPKEITKQMLNEFDEANEEVLNQKPLIPLYAESSQEIMKYCEYVTLKLQRKMIEMGEQGAAKREINALRDAQSQGDLSSFKSEFLDVEFLKEWNALVMVLENRGIIDSGTANTTNLFSNYVDLLIGISTKADGGMDLNYFNLGSYVFWNKISTPLNEFSLKEGSNADIEAVMNGYNTVKNGSDVMEDMLQVFLGFSPHGKAVWLRKIYHEQFRNRAFNFALEKGSSQNYVEVNLGGGSAIEPIDFYAGQIARFVNLPIFRGQHNKILGKTTLVVVDFDQGALDAALIKYNGLPDNIKNHLDIVLYRANLTKPKDALSSMPYKVGSLNIEDIIGKALDYFQGNLLIDEGLSDYFNRVGRTGLNQTAHALCKDTGLRLHGKMNERVKRFDFLFSHLGWQELNRGTSDTIIEPMNDAGFLPIDKVKTLYYTYVTGVKATSSSKANQLQLQRVEKQDTKEVKVVEVEA